MEAARTTKTATINQQQQQQQPRECRNDQCCRFLNRF